VEVTIFCMHSVIIKYTVKINELFICACVCVYNKCVCVFVYVCIISVCVCVCTRGSQKLRVAICQSLSTL
jgi:hypothetical protein